MPGSIVVVGSVNMDLVVRAPRHPQPGETILGSSFQTFPGGKGANQAVAASRMGGQVRMIARVGSDSFGDTLMQTLQNDGVDTRFVSRSEGISSGVALITVSDAGQNNIVVVPGSNGMLSPADIQLAEPAFQGAAVVLLQLEIPMETVAAAVRMARKHGAKVVLNPAPAQPLSPELLAQVDYLAPNEYELALLTGAPVAEISASTLQALGVRSLIVTLGSEGVLSLERNTATRILPYNVTVVDTTAAGDAFVGAFAVALTEGKNTREAIAFGNAAGALAVTKAGAQPSLPARAAVDDFIASHPPRFSEDAR